MATPLGKSVAPSNRGWESIARSPWDELWWRHHAAMCAESPSPCRISCEKGALRRQPLAVRLAFMTLPRQYLGVPNSLCSSDPPGISLDALIFRNLICYVLKHFRFTVPSRWQ